MASNGGEKDNYEIGFAKPPEEHQFKPGRSGNPSGRPKGTKNMNTILMKAARDIVVINEGGKRKRMSKLEVIFKQLTNKAIAGDLGATRLVLSVLASAEAKEATHETMTSTLCEDDKQVMSRLFAAIKGADNENN